MAHRRSLASIVCAMALVSGCGALLGIDDLGFEAGTGGQSTTTTTSVGQGGAGGVGGAVTTSVGAGGSTGGSGGAGTGGQAIQPFGLVMVDGGDGNLTLTSPGQFAINVDAQHAVATTLVDLFGATPVDRGNPQAPWLAPGAIRPLVSSTRELTAFSNLAVTVDDRSPVEVRFTFSGSYLGDTATGQIEVQANGKIWMKFGGSAALPGSKTALHQLMQLPGSWAPAQMVSEETYQRVTADGALTLLAVGPANTSPTHEGQGYSFFETSLVPAERFSRLILAPSIVSNSLLVASDEPTLGGAGSNFDGFQSVGFVHEGQVIFGDVTNEAGRTTWTMTFSPSLAQYFPGFHIDSWVSNTYAIYRDSVEPSNLLVSSADNNTGLGVANLSGTTLRFILRDDIVPGTPTTIVIVQDAP